MSYYVICSGCCNIEPEFGDMEYCRSCERDYCKKCSVVYQPNDEANVYFPNGGTNPKRLRELLESETPPGCKACRKGLPCFDIENKYYDKKEYPFHNNWKEKVKKWKEDLQ
ncbi:hypothetical protein DFS34DRAFT_590199 [Phlyctochytrium arcticum]|nr:hypothetical protein DFS34DRAFT_590199 [Phlyctochytrium arcticum]